jgi:hypothetical protein
MMSCILFTSCLNEKKWYVLGMSTKVSIKGLCATWWTMANATVPWQHITVPMSYLYIQTQKSTSLWIQAAWCMRFMLKTIEKIAFLWRDNTFVVPQSLWHYDTLTLRYMTWQQNIQSPWFKKCKPDSLSKTFDLQPFSMKHISFTWQPQKSL